MRNFTIAMLPMCLPVDAVDMAVGLMLLTLVTGIVLMIWCKPRRTPSMNMLDCFISFAQIAILGIGGMSVYETAVREELSTILLLITVSVLVVGGLTLLRAGIHMALKMRNIEVFLSHHSGGGGSAARVMHVVFLKLMKGKTVFFDIDNLGYFGVIFDAIKMSQFVVFMFSSESLCRDWCIGEIVAAHQKNLPMQTVVMSEIVELKKDGKKGSQTGTSDADVEVSLNFEVDGSTLRPHGVAQADIHPAIVQLMSLPSITFDMSSSDKLSTMLTEILVKRPRTELGQSIDSVVDSFFGGHEFKAAAIRPKSSVLLMCDHDDTEAIAVSRLFQLFISAKLSQIRIGVEATGSGGPKMRNSAVSGLGAAHAQLASFDDVDLSADDYCTLVKSNGIAALLVCITSHTMKSIPQLARMGLVHQYIPEIQPIPIVIGQTFNFPSDALLTKIEQGQVLPLGPDPEGTLAKYAGEPVSLKSIKEAMQHTLGFFIAFVAVATLDSAHLRNTTMLVMRRVADIMSPDNASQSYRSACNPDEPAA